MEKIRVENEIGRLRELAAKNDSIITENDMAIGELIDGIMDLEIKGKVTTIWTNQITNEETKSRDIWRPKKERLSKIKELEAEKARKVEEARTTRPSYSDVARGASRDNTRAQSEPRQRTVDVNARDRPVNQQIQDDNRMRLQRHQRFNRRFGPRSQRYVAPRERYNVPHQRYEENLFTWQPATSFNRRGRYAMRRQRGGYNRRFLWQRDNIDRQGRV